MLKKIMIVMSCCMVGMCGASEMQQTEKFLDSRPITRRHSEPPTLRPTKVEDDIARSKSVPLVSKIISIDEINKQYPYLPYRGRLAVLRSQIAAKHGIQTFAVINQAKAKEYVDIIYEEGKACIEFGDFSTANFISLVLHNPDETFCFETSFQQGKFHSKEEYLSIENSIYDLSDEKSKELIKTIKEKNE